MNLLHKGIMFSLTSQMIIVLVWFLCASSGAIISSVMRQGRVNDVGCNEKDEYALSMFREGIEDPSNWLSSWSTEEDCCKWEGVQCDNITGRVTELNLNCLYRSGNCLGGEINFSIFELEFLSYLRLSSNEFKAIRFPPIQCGSSSSFSCKNFSNLLWLDLSDNPHLHMDNLTWVSRFPALKFLDLSGITIHETLWLQQLTVLPSLVELYLSNCSLTGIAFNPSLESEYVNFTSLEILDISNNYFDSEIPKWLFSLNSSVYEIDLSSCHLHGQIPSTLVHLQQLDTLLLDSNNLNGSIPEWMGQYKHLQHLDLSTNSFSGPIPAAFGNISSLRFLDVSNNRLNGSLPVDLGKLSKLEFLSVGYNSLSGNLSEQLFTELSNLELLLIEESAFTFQVGTDWQPPFQLEEFRAANCKLGPEFPSWLYTQRSLSYLEITSSGLSFTAYQEFWEFVSQIASVNLYNNSISGGISISMINNLAINLNANNLTGKLPRLSPGVYFFSVADNSLSGPISPSLCQSMSNESKLEHLDLSNNLFSGEFPDCWTLFRSLWHLSLGGNKLTGGIPDSIGSLKELQTLRLHNTNLSGNMPASLESFAQLWFLDLRFNHFTGNIPSWISRLSIILLLRSNRFNGTIPSQLCQLPNLAVLDLANNSLSGPIPKCLHIQKAVIDTINNDLSEPYFNNEYATYLPETYSEDLNLLVKGNQLSYKKNILLLRVVDLSSNELTGSVPPELFSLSALQSLNLSHNHLKGVIPSEIGHMSFLESLDLSSNLFSGEIPQSVSNLSFLSHLNLSYNNFKGMIPLSTQLQSFDAFSYIGNPELCGAPLPRNCTQGDNHPGGSKWMEDKDKDHDFRSSFYIGMGVGFAFAFWLVSGTLFFIRRWRHAYFRILDNLYVFIAVKMNHFFQS